MKSEQDNNLEQIAAMLEQIAEKLQKEYLKKSGQDNIFKSIVLINGAVEFLIK